MGDIPTIDVHTHCHMISSIGIQAMGGTPSVSGYTGIIPELLPMMEQHNITHVAMANFTPIGPMVDAARARLPAGLTEEQRAVSEAQIRRDMVGRIRRRNEWSCLVTREHPNLLTFIGLDPVMTPEGMAAEVEQRHAQGARGIKLHTAVQRVALNDRRLWPAYRAAEALGMVFLPHTGPFGDVDLPGARPGVAAEVLTDFPRLKVILTHCGGQPYFQESIALAQQFPQVNFDCCGVVRGEPQPGSLNDEELVALFRALGMERMTFGSDWPFADAIPDIERIHRLPMTEAEKRMMLSENAMRILDL